VRPIDLIPSDLRDRLDAAREYLDISIEWFDEGAPECCGRAGGFWRVRAGPAGWPQRPRREYRYGERRDQTEDGPLSVEWHRLGAVIAKALDAAERRWPESLAVRKLS
jgi:hypothetical protein